MRIKIKLRLKYLMLTGLLFWFISACTYDTILPKEQEVPDVVSFQNDIQPIFDINCNTAGCHNMGGIAPILTSGNAWFNLVFFDYVDTLNAFGSLLYKKIDGGSMTAFASDQDRAIILSWIEQGAKDN